jgi:putative flippase GtrA
MVGAVATVLDVVSGTLLLALGVPTRWCAMAGVVVGGTFAFFANRSFSFRQQGQPLGMPAVKYVLATGAAMLLHGQVVVWLRDSFGVPFVVSKVLADLAVFSLGQLVVLRYLVFTAKPDAPPAPPEPPTP